MSLKDVFPLGGITWDTTERGGKKTNKQTNPFIIQEKSSTVYSTLSNLTKKHRQLSISLFLTEPVLPG